MELLKGAEPLYSLYTDDYTALEGLKPLGAKHGVAIVVVHHLRKMGAVDPMDEISASTGFTGGIDGSMILRRVPGSKGPTLFVEGRDIETGTVEYALIWNHNTATWSIEGEAEEVHISKERAEILLTINRHGVYMSPKEVSDAMGPHAKYNNVKYLMWTMLGDGQLIKNDDGKYYPTNPTNSTNLTNSANSTNPTQPNAHRVSGLAGATKTTNPDAVDTYAGNGTSVSGVSGVSTGHPLTCLCDECVPV